MSRTPASIAVYVSGHGYGHSTRTAAILRRLLDLRPALRIHIRTTAPRRFFPVQADYHEVEIDAEIVESADAVWIDHEATRANLHGLLSRADSLIRREAAWVRGASPSLLLADLPYLAGYIARETGIPAIALGNFTWDWIYQPLLAAEPAAVDFIRDGYIAFQLALRFPLSQPEGWDVFPTVEDVPLVTQRSTRPPAEILEGLGLAGDSRTRVLVGGRGKASSGALDAAAKSAPECLFLCRGDDYDGSAPNVQKFDFGGRASFSDVLRISNLVVSKLGYSLGAECIAERKPLLYPPRAGFREDEFLPAAVRRQTAAREAPSADFASGNWAPHLRQLSQEPMPELDLPLDGDEVCARRIAELL